MIDGPVSPRFHARQVIDTALTVVVTVAFAVEIHLEEFANPRFIDAAHVFMIAKASRIGMHEDIRFRYIAEILGIRIPEHGIIVTDTVFHDLIRFDRKIFVIADVIHEIVIIVTA